MNNVIDFPLSAYKLSPEEEDRLAKSSAFPPGYFSDLETVEITKAWYESLKTDGQKHHDLKMELKRITLWDRIFNWPYGR